MISISCASATTVYVNATNGSDTSGNGSAVNPFHTIQKGVDNITDGDSIIIAIGQYNGTGNTNITLNKNMTIKGQSQSGTIINGTDTNWIFHINTGLNVTLQDLTLANGNKSPLGSAIWNYGTCIIN
ncbi:MAG TPA: hypothetical protein VK426_08110, partial [Methanobacterium sp.]|nr:hypothetical protein [Methanobacterium sp.]